MIHEQEKKICQNCKTSFIIDDQDKKFYEKIKVPAPTFCPDCRLQRRYAWRNLRSIYKRTCDLCKKDTIGVFSPDKPFKAYCSPCWWSEGWDAMEYGRDYDFSRPFFDQYYDLLKTVPLLSRYVFENTMARSDYTNMANDLKDCYLVFHAEVCERCTYCDDISNTNDCMDCSFAHYSELCYDSFELQKCNRVHFSRNCENCFDSYFLRDCVSCNNCFGSVNLRHKQYYIFNKPYNKETYFAKLKEMGFDSNSRASVEKFIKQAQEFHTQFPVKYIHAQHNQKVSGNYIFNSKNTFHSFNVRGLEDSKFCSFLAVPKVKDSYDWSIYGENGELMYEMLQAGQNVYNNRFGWCIWIGTRNTEYAILNIDSSDCFGCIGIKKQKYCILNKKYTKEEYETLREKIIAHMKEMPFKDKKGSVYSYGEFFPTPLSPFGYNETMAQEDFPLNESSAQEQGYQWADIDKFRGTYTPTKKAGDIPDNISDVGDDILKEIIECQTCKKPYRIIKQELNFYRKESLPLPHLCPECRYQKRIAYKNPFRLFMRSCNCGGIQSDPPKTSGQVLHQNTTEHFHKQDHCPNTFQTSYTPEKQDIVYCENCYLSEVA